MKLHMEDRNLQRFSLCDGEGRLIKHRIQTVKYFLSWKLCYCSLSVANVGVTFVSCYSYFKHKRLKDICVLF